ncbi:MAG: IS4 family transposase [Patescibacteria group bacterium]
MKTGDVTFKKINNKINSIEFMKRSKYADKDFTRKRKLPFVSLIFFMINLVKQTLQKELTNFISLISSSKENITKSAFSQSRRKLKAGAFIELNDTLVESFYEDDDFKKWKGFRLLAIDGTCLTLPQSNEIIKDFGFAKNNVNPESIIPMAKISSYYDLLNGIIIDSQIDQYKISEFMLALAHLDKAGKKDLIIFDRGYAATWFFIYMNLKNVDYIVRLQRNFLQEFDSFWNSKENSEIIRIDRCSEKSRKALEILGINFDSFKIRLVKVILDNGEVEVLATSLLDDEKYLYSEFKDIYFLRWGIETNYDHLKNNLAIENFTGLSTLSVTQDFFANMFIVNLQAVIINDVQIEIDEEKKDTEYKYKINRNLSLGFMKDRVIKIFLSNNSNGYNELKKLFKLEPVPIRKGRKFERKFKLTKRKYSITKKKSV